MAYQYKREPLTPDEANRLANACEGKQADFTSTREAAIARFSGYLDNSPSTRKCEICLLPLPSPDTP